MIEVGGTRQPFLVRQVEVVSLLAPDELAAAGLQQFIETRDIMDAHPEVTAVGAAGLFVDKAALAALNEKPVLV